MSTRRTRPDARGSDAAYLAAVRRGDMGAAAAILDRVARAAGYAGPWYHGGTVENSFAGGGGPFPHFYLTECPDVAAGYADQFSPREGRIAVLYAREGRVLDMTDQAAFWRWAGPVGDRYFSEGRNMAATGAFRSGSPLIRRARDEGYDAIRFYDTDVYNRGSVPALLLFDPRRAKLAPRGIGQAPGATWWGREVRDGTVATDDSGELIPPSRRFDPASDDLRGIAGAETDGFPRHRAEPGGIPSPVGGRAR